jgi:hypothetical protein
MLLSNLLKAKSNNDPKRMIAINENAIMAE